MSKLSTGSAPTRPRASSAKDAARLEVALEEAASELWGLHGYAEEELVERVRAVLAHERKDRGRLHGRGH